MTEDDLKKYEKRSKKNDGESKSFESAHPSMTFNDIRYRQLYDKHATGNGYIELIHDEQGDLTALFPLTFAVYL